MAYFQGRTVSFRECIHAEQLGHGGAMYSLYLALGFKARVKWLNEGYQASLGVMELRFRNDEIRKTQRSSSQTIDAARLTYRIKLSCIVWDVLSDEQMSNG